MFCFKKNWLKKVLFLCWWHVIYCPNFNIWCITYLKDAPVQCVSEWKCPKGLLNWLILILDFVNPLQIDCMTFASRICCTVSCAAACLPITLKYNISTSMGKVGVACPVENQYNTVCTSGKCLDTQLVKYRHWRKVSSRYLLCFCISLFCRWKLGTPWTFSFFFVIALILEKILATEPTFVGFNKSGVWGFIYKGLSKSATSILSCYVLWPQ